MTYTVVWVRSAEADLARYWTQARDRRTFTDAADQIDRILRTHGPSVGSVVEGERRRLTIRPLTVDFNVSEADLKVTVVDVRIRNDALWDDLVE
jgi:hypothetical protein